MSLGQFKSDEKLKTIFKNTAREIAAIFKSSKLIFMQEHGIAGLPFEVGENKYSSIEELIDLMKVEQSYFEVLE